MRRVEGAVLVVVVAAIAGCVEVKEPDPPVIIMPDSVGGGSTTCDCLATDVTGRAYRVESLQIDEPEVFASILNEMWAGDIRNNVLNVIFQVAEAVQGAGVSEFDKLLITAGPSWREPKEPWTNPAPEGEPTESVIDTYCQLEGLSIGVELQPYRNLQCTFKSTDMKSLYFHSGPKDMPFICAPQNTPPNNIPIKNLKIRATLNEDCTAIADGYLEGCISVDAADKICMCPGGAGECDRASLTPDQLDAVAFDPKKLGDYCHTVCGQKWISFGNLIHAVSLDPTCVVGLVQACTTNADCGAGGKCVAGECPIKCTADADCAEGAYCVQGTCSRTGYRVQGFFTATAIPDQFNPVQSSDCSVH